MDIEPVKGAASRRSGFVQILTTIYDDRKVGSQEVYFIGYCLSRSSTWQFDIYEIALAMKAGRNAAYAAINNCIEHGYAYRHKYKEGKFLRYKLFVSDSKEDIELIRKGIEQEEKPTEVEYGKFPTGREITQNEPKLNEPIQDDVSKFPIGREITQNEPEQVECSDIENSQCPICRETIQNTSNGPVEASHIECGKFPICREMYISNNNTHKNTTTEDTGPVVVFSHKEVQKEEAPEVEQPKDPKAPEIWPVLQPVNIPEHAKLWLTKTYPEEVVNNGVAKALHPSTVINKNLESTIKWACKLGLKVEKTAKEIASEQESDKQRQQAEMIAKHRALALPYDRKTLGVTKVHVDQCGVFFKGDDPRKRDHSILFTYETFPESFESWTKWFSDYKRVEIMQVAHNINYQDVPRKDTQILPVSSKETISETFNNQDKTIEQNKEYALSYHLEEFGNVMIFVGDRTVAFSKTRTDDNHQLKELFLMHEDFQQHFNAALSEYNFPRLELCKAGA